jgi:hypothetical protein
VQLALEVLTAACATLPDPEIGPAGEEEIDEDEDLDVGMYPCSNMLIGIGDTLMVD